MAKKATILVKLVSSADTGVFFVRKKNPKKFTGKLNFMKYDPVKRQRVMFHEKKLSS